LTGIGAFAGHRPAFAFVPVAFAEGWLPTHRQNVPLAA
jgi:hypothetical protein